MIACLTDPVTEERYRASRARLPIMQRFEQMLDENADEPLYLAEVCAAVGVSDRTLRLHCQEQLGMSPHRYLWLRRMNLVRRALSLADSTVRTVTEIANDHGFAELGRFAVAYRNLFGESPSITLRRAPDDRRSVSTVGHLPGRL
jgi:AraC-like DNA-binding protein